MRQVNVCSLFPFLICCIASAADWPQFQQNAAHTGWTQDSPQPPFGVEWSVSFEPETVGVVQPIVYNDTLYIPTLQGRLYALDPPTGNRLWVQEGLGTVTRSAAASDGLVFTANLDGQVIAVKADGGGVVWTSDLGFAISAFPCVDGGRLYIGNRRGELFCLECASGRTLWKTPLEGYLWAGAAAAGGKVYAATDRVIRMHCLDAGTGAILWQSARLPGVFVREWCPVIAADKVFLHTMPPEYDFPVCEPFSTWWETPDAFLKFQPDLRAGRIPQEIEAAMDNFLAAIGEKPTRQTLFVFDAETGAVPYIPTHMQVGSLWFGCPPPPAVDSQGMLQVRVPYDRARFGRMDPRTGRYVDILVGDVVSNEPNSPDKIGTNTDEAHASACGGDWVYWVHFGPGNCDSSLAFNVKTREFAHWPSSAAAPPTKYPVVKKRDPPAAYVSAIADQRPEAFAGWHMMRVRMTLEDRTDESGSAAPAIWKDFLFKFATKGEDHLYAVRGYNEPK